MIIETKHSTGDWVYTINEDKIVHARITSISIWLHLSEGSRILVTYSLHAPREFSENFNKYESKCFATKEELLQSL
jgi:hypothetical protein